MHYLKGHLFENFIISDIQKQFFNRAKIPATYFWRDSHGNEVDCIVEKDGKLLPVEIKAGMTLSLHFIKGLTYWQNLAQVDQGILVYGGDEELQIKKVAVKSWKNFSIFSFGKSFDKVQ